MSIRLGFYDSSELSAAADTLRDHDFVELHNGEWCHLDSAVYSESLNEYLHCEEASTCENCHDAYYTDDCDSVYTDDGCNYCSPDCAESAGNYCHSDGVWYDYPENQDGLLDYSTSNHKKDPTSPEAPYLIGFEVEKEDEDGRSTAAEDANCENWIAVEDGSLDSDTGYELVSPAYNLANIETELIPTLLRMDCLDADTTTSCGGHISVSDCRCTPRELATRCMDGIALLHALYMPRLTNEYAKPYKPHKLTRSDKYSSVCYHDNRIELRMISRVKNRKQLVWRVRLIDWILSENRPTVATALADPQSLLYGLLSQIYSADQIRKKATLAANFLAWLEEQDDSVPAAEAIANLVPPPVANFKNSERKRETIEQAIYWFNNQHYTEYRIDDLSHRVADGGGYLDIATPDGSCITIYNSDRNYRMWSCSNNLNRYTDQRREVSSKFDNLAGNLVYQQNHATAFAYNPRQRGETIQRHTVSTPSSLVYREVWVRYTDGQATKATTVNAYGERTEISVEFAESIFFDDSAPESPAPATVPTATAELVAF